MFAPQWSEFYAFGQVSAPIGVQPEYTYVPVDSTTEVPMEGAAAVIGIGYEVARTGNVVFAVEADISFGNYDSGQVLVDTTPCITNAPDEACRAEVSAIATGRALIGYKQGAFTPYITGGVAIARASGHADTGACGGSDCDFDEALTGWTAGLGIIYDINETFALKADLLQYELEDPEFGSDSVTGSFRFGEIRIGAVYRF
ncbi:outer membrane protein, putative [Roseobacter sp. CCS2]|nr:outer membrane protein, putative [Roseobacter sp. CCS2]